MAKKSGRIIVTLECTEAKAEGKPVSRYTTTKNKTKTPGRMEKRNTIQISSATRFIARLSEPESAMILTDQEILNSLKTGDIKISPFNRECLGSNSYDVHLGSTLATYVDSVLDAKKHNLIQSFEIPAEGFVLEPNVLYLGVTQEYTESLKHVPFLEGKSSVGRLGIDIHATAGKGDVGFCNYWTLEISAKQRVRVYSGMPIGQLIYFETKGSPLVPYNEKLSAKYNQKTQRPVESMMWKNQF